MIRQQYQWIEETQKPDDGFFKRAKELGLAELEAQLAFNRGIRTDQALEDYVNPDLSQLHDPFLLHDMEKAVERLKLAIAQGERILIYGDYDADGMTSSSVAQEALEMLGAEVQVYLPNRFTDGYGPNKSVYKYFIEQEDISLILTVDNGVAGHEAIAFAQESGVDVIVTDHHSLPERLPDAFAIIHPEHPDSRYPFKYLAGVGVAFKLACALLEEVPQEMLDLVAIGTIADMVSLTDENRVLVSYGLSILKQTERIGLQELLHKANVTMSTLDEETVGFTIAPALNALGRLDDPNPAIALLTGFDDEEAADIAQLLLDKNDERKALVQTIYDEVLAMVDKSKSAQVLAKEGWHPGVLGIVAGRLLQDLAQPVVMLNITDGIAKGSARSPEVVNIFDALDSHREIFQAFGGHAGAAGMTLSVEHLDDLAKALDDYIADNAIDLTQKNPLTVDSELDLTAIDLDTIREVKKLAPFGMDNPKPHFLLKDITVTSSKAMGKKGEHLKLRLKKDDTAVDLVAFFQGKQALDFQQGSQIEFVVSLSVNEWNGKTSVQLMYEDARVDGIQLLDVRRKNAQIPQDIPTLEEAPASLAVVIDHIPEDITALKTLLKSHPHEAIYFKNRLEPNYYLTGFGTREQFAHLYKTIYQYPEFDVRYKLGDLANYLKIPQALLVKMIQIFDELDFVTITDGIMTVNKAAERKEISSSQIYQDLKETVKVQELLTIGTPKEIYDFLMAD